MKKMTKVYAQIFGAKTKDMPIHLPAEQMTERETAASTSPQSNLPTGQKQANHPAPQIATKSKKRRIPFVAFVLILVFSSLCAFLFLVQLPFAQAKGDLSSSAHLQHSASTSLDASPSVDCTETNTCAPDGNPYNELSGGEYAIVSTQPCIDHKNADSSLTNICESDQDYYWGNSDITCVDNPNLLTEQLPNLLSAFSTSLPQPASSPEADAGPANLQNENTCTYDNFNSRCSSNDNTCRVCYSDNSSGTDQNSTTVHDQGAGGDDIFCYNKTCSPDATPTTSTNYSELCGTGQPFNKWACSPLPNTLLFYNPTAYMPLGALDIPTQGAIKHGSGGALGIQSAPDPTCDGGLWGCSNGGNMVMKLYQASVSGSSPNQPADSSGHNDAFTTGNPEQISNTPITIHNFTGTRAANGGRPYVSDRPSVNVVGPNGSAIALPPIYEVECTVQGTGAEFPCSDNSDSTVNLIAIEKDWLSGNGLEANDDPNHPTTGVYPSGHLSTTYNNDTISSHLLQTLFSSMLAVAYLLIAPIAILIGYRVLWASWTFRNTSVMEDLGRLLLGIMAIAISFQLVTLMIGLTNLFNHAIIQLHIELPYTSAGVSELNSSNTAYILKGDTDPASFRGIVQPIVRWGCTMNTFVEILKSKFWTDFFGAITPLFGGLEQLAGRISDAVTIVHNIGAFATLLLSIALCVQVYLRVLFINYYIATAPLVFACWALPGGGGGKLMGQWARGLISVLLVQTVQLFVLTTMPILLPPFPPLEAVGSGAWGIFNEFFNQLPAVLVLLATIQVPKLMGTGVTKVLANAGTVAAGGVAAIAGAAYSIV